MIRIEIALKILEVEFIIAVNRVDGNVNNTSFVVAIDGPSGSGKSTVAIELARCLSAMYIDTGAMFRTIAYLLKDRGYIDGEHIARTFELDKFLKDLHWKSSSLHMVDGEDVRPYIRDLNISSLASKISLNAKIRQYLLGKQREIGRRGLCLMEGRDIGSIVFSNSFCKIFLTASLPIRARRRFEELQSKEYDKYSTLTEVKESMAVRDLRDSQRKESPLKQVKDAIVVDSSHFTFREVIDILLSIIKKKKLEHGLL